MAVQIHLANVTNENCKIEKNEIDYFFVYHY